MWTLKTKCLGINVSFTYQATLCKLFNIFVPQFLVFHGMAVRVSYICKILGMEPDI